MKHGLKQKYKWKERTAHFKELEIMKDFASVFNYFHKKALKEALDGSVWDKLEREKSKDIQPTVFNKINSFTNSSDVDQKGEGAMKGGDDTTSSSNNEITDEDDREFYKL